MTLYETIFTRRSVRKYDKEPVDSSLIEDIKKFIADTKQFEHQNARFEIVSNDQIKGSSAPHHILAFCDDNDSAYANVGYVLEKTDLYLQSIGLGSVWLGMAKPNEKPTDYCILLAFGKTDVPCRTSVQDFNRLPLKEISNADNSIANAARLAPSAVNSQPWKLHFEDNKILVQYFGRGLMKLILRKKLSKIDLGIITRHLETALLNEQKEILSIEPKSSGKEFMIEISYR